MTASMITPFSTTNSTKAFFSDPRNRIMDFTLQVYDFDGQCYQFEVEATNEDEAYDMDSIDLAYASNGSLADLHLRPILKSTVQPRNHETE